MSPMCWLNHAYFPSATAMVFLRSAPTASVGGTGTGSAIGSGAYPRERRIGIARRSPHDHAHDGVVARHQDRAVVHQPAIGEMRKPFERIIVGEADRFTGRGCPEVITSTVRAGLVAGQAEEQRVQRRVGEHDAEVGIVRGHRIGDGGTRSAWHQHDRPLCTGQHACREPSSTSAMVRAVARSGTITANGLSPRRFRVRNSATARSLAGVAGEVVAADALDRDMPPSRSNRRACRSPASPTRSTGRCRRGSVSVGPQFGQQTGWAWNRRSAGSSYSRAQSAHIAKGAIVVDARS